MKERNLFYRSLTIVGLTAVKNFSKKLFSTDMYFIPICYQRWAVVRYCSSGSATTVETE